VWKKDSLGSLVRLQDSSLLDSGKLRLAQIIYSNFGLAYKDT